MTGLERRKQGVSEPHPTVGADLVARIDALGEFFAAQYSRYKAAPEEAKKAINFGDSKPPADLDPAELATWTLVANLILNLDEAIMRN